jgi:3-oxoacyl-[acyl-carrier-protein] synthase I
LRRVVNAFSCNGTHLTQPTGLGAEPSMNGALRLARVHPSEVDHLHAHATSTPTGDSVEAAAIHRVFSRSRVPVSSTKASTGHECWMSGASEVANGLLMMRDGFIAGNPNPEMRGGVSAALQLPVSSLPVPGPSSRTPLALAAPTLLWS